MKKYTGCLLGLMYIFLCGLIVAFHLDFSAAVIILKSLTSLCFTALGILNYTRFAANKGFGKRMLAAFFCSLCGDVLLALDHGNGILFVIGVVSFAAAHILFSIAFSKLSETSGFDVFVALGIFMPTLSILLFGGEFDYQGLFPVLVFYTAIISLMVAKAISVRKGGKIPVKAANLLAIGAVLFIFSDIVLLYWLFGIDMPKLVQSVNWVLYYSAQGCLSLSLGCCMKITVTEK